MLLNSFWLSALKQYKKIKIGFSGGLDSSVLLHTLAKSPDLLSKIEAIHINHGISGNALAWQEFCQRFCDKLGINLRIEKVNIEGSAHIEELARNARYAIFNKCLKEGECIVLAHHKNDQVETLLFNLFRGTGIDGLASIPERRKLGLGEIVRPFLNLSRDSLYRYAKQNNLDWIDDESNLNVDFSRNFIRHEILPVITKKWTNALQNISDCANKCAIARDNLMQLAQIDCPTIFSMPLQLELDFIRSLSEERIINILRNWLKYNEVLSPAAHALQRIVNEVIMAKPDKLPQIAVGNALVTRYRNSLYIISKNVSECSDLAWTNFPGPLHLKDGRVITATLDKYGSSISKASDVSVRFRVGGEVIKHNGKSKKLKKLFQEFSILPWERDLLPLLYVDGKLQAVIGVLAADDEVSDICDRYKFEVC